MPSRLIINADDFGLTLGINRAVAELHAAGALTSATLMACGDAFDNAVEIAKAYPALGVGCHIVLVDGTPTAPPSEVSTLLQPGTGKLRSSLVDFLIALHRGRIDPAHIEIEATAQMRKLQSAGLTLTHFDTHKHTHVFPHAAIPLFRAATTCGIHSIRNPYEPRWSASVTGSRLRRAVLNVIHRSDISKSFFSLPEIVSRQIRTSDGCIGVSATGSLNKESLRSILSLLPDHGTYELVTHPGYNDADLGLISTTLRHQREIEREALTQGIPASGQALTTFANLDDGRATSITSTGANEYPSTF